MNTSTSRTPGARERLKAEAVRPFTPGRCLSLFSASSVFEDVLAAMQRADELGGPDSPEYIVLMDAIIEEATDRRENRRRGMADAGPDLPHQ